MRKLLALALILTMMFALAIPATAMVNITAPNVAITIDGIRDDGYAGPIPITHDFRDPGATGNAWVAWNDGKIYFYIEVADTTPNHAADVGGDHNVDCLEIFFDWNSGRGGAGEASDATPYWQVRIPSGPNGDGDFAITGQERNDDGVNWSKGEDFMEICEWIIVPLNGSLANGYIAEIAIPAPAVAPLSEGKTLHFDICINDNIDGSERGAQVFIAASDENDQQWQTPESCMGFMTLGGAPAVSAPADDEPAADAGDAPAPQRPAPKTGDAGMIVLVALMAAAAAIVALRRKAVR